MSQRPDFLTVGLDAVNAMIGLEKHIARSSLEKPLRELVRLRVSQINGCAYCMDMHASDARKAGENERRLSTLVAWRETTFFNERECAALAWAEAVTQVSQEHVPDSVWSEVQEHFSDAEMIDLTLLVVAINGWNRFAIAFRKQPVGSVTL
jgi:AhpD family alkylhydroperoxidase